jgi:protocatechuate 3,4-dioxygenase beta subunit
MSELDERTLTRGAFLRLGLAAPAALAVAGAGVEIFGPIRRWEESMAHAHGLPQPPACSPGAGLTAGNADGPYYRLYTPERRSFRGDLAGAVLLTLSGTVLDEQCQPVAGTVLDFWHASQNGEYDLSGYHLRGHQYTGGDGTYLLETIVPRWYIDGSLWRTSHIHVKVQPPNGPILTTQLFFPDNLQAYGQDTASLNAQDFLVPPEGIAKVTIGLGPLVANHYAGVFNFIIPTSYPTIPGS